MESFFPSEAVQIAFQAGIGLLLGSFIGLLSVRLPAGETWIWTRSRCRSCEEPLSPVHLVPLVSWLVQRGRHSSCGARISIRYPLLEIISALIGAGAAWMSPGLPGLLGAILGWQLLLIGLVDAEHLWLPDHLTIPLAMTGVGAALLEPASLISRLAGGLFGFAFLTGLAWAFRRLRGKEGLGGGDPLLLAGIGCWLGLASIPGLLLCASILGIAWGVIAQKLANADQEMRLPFGTFMAIAAVCVWSTNALEAAQSLRG